MWDEEINKKIKDAADQYHPAYDDSAWSKMEQMLDEHLPRKKDRRRIIYFLPLILLLAGVMFFMLSRKEALPSSRNSEKPVANSGPGKSRDGSLKASAKETLSNPAPVKPVNSVAAIASPFADVKGKNEIIKQPSPPAEHPAIKKGQFSSIYGTSALITAGRITRPVPEVLADNKVGQKKNRHLHVKGNAGITSKNGIAETMPQMEESSNKQSASPGIADLVSPSAAANNSVADDNTLAKDNTVAKDVNTGTSKDENKTIPSKDVAKAESQKDAKGKIDQKKTKKNFLQRFGFGLSIGPDVSGVKLSNTGKITLAYGTLLSYSITDKFTLRTGFYVANKIYSTDNDEYHAAAGSTWNTYLQSVGANCKVFEMPLTVSYNFSKTKNHNLFASAGLSSYFMKRESYIYYYKNAADSTYSKPWTVQNKNKHYFSVLNISAGYEYFINKRFSITGEPYLKLPLSGIGAGKIKLNSAGVLFTVAIKPF